jgi:hypothetical protein
MCISLTREREELVGKLPLMGGVRQYASYAYATPRGIIKDCEYKDHLISGANPNTFQSKKQKSLICSQQTCVFKLNNFSSCQNTTLTPLKATYFDSGGGAPPVVGRPIIRLVAFSH